MFCEGVNPVEQKYLRLSCRQFKLCGKLKITAESVANSHNKIERILRLCERDWLMGVPTWLGINFQLLILTFAV